MICRQKRCNGELKLVEVKGLIKPRPKQYKTRCKLCDDESAPFLMTRPRKRKGRGERRSGRAPRERRVWWA